MSDDEDRFYDPAEDGWDDKAQEFVVLEADISMDESIVSMGDPTSKGKLLLWRGEVWEYWSDPGEMERCDGDLEHEAQRFIRNVLGTGVDGEIDVSPRGGPRRPGNCARASSSSERTHRRRLEAGLHRWRRKKRQIRAHPQRRSSASA